MVLIMRALVLAALLLTSPASAQVGGVGGGSIDPMYVPPNPLSYIINKNTGARTLGTQTVSSAVRNLIIIAAGQSNMTDIAPNYFTPVNPTKIDQMNIYDGAIYNAIDPLLGTTQSNVPAGHPILRAADTYIQNNKFDRVIIVPVAIASTSIADWATGYCSAIIPAAIKRLAARGIVSGTNVTIAIFWGQGENDTNSGTTQTAYTTGLNSVIAKSRAAGFAGPWFVAKQSWYVSTVSSAIQAAQAAVLNSGSGVYAGPDADSLVGSVCSGQPCRQGDNLHWSDFGSFSYAGGWVTATAASGAPF